MSGFPKDFAEDVHTLVHKLDEAVERVLTAGDGRSMPTIEANAVSRDEAIKEAGESVRDGLMHVAHTLDRLVNELASARQDRHVRDATTRTADGRECT